MLQSTALLRVGATSVGPKQTTAAARKQQTFNSQYTKGSMRGGVPRIYYGWMRPGSITRRRFEKKRNPFVDLETGQSLYYRDTRDPVEAVRAEADSAGIKGTDNAVDLYNEYRIVPDLYPEGFQWKHKLNTEYNQWRSNTWLTPDLIPAEHRGRFLANFQLNIGCYDMRVAKFSPKDSRQWIYCCLYVGTGKGIAGWGQAVAPSSVEAKKEAIRNAFTNIVAADLSDEGPVYPLRLNVDGVRVQLYPARRIVASFRAADILCAFGFVHCGLRLNQRASNKPRGVTKFYGATFEAVKAMRSSTEIAHARGKVPHSLVSNIFPFMEEIRRRKGMFAMHPDKKSGLHLNPDRVVDNRMPDHLKKGYYDDQYWKDFFAGSKEHLHEPKLGLRADELRQLVPQMGSDEARRVSMDAQAQSVGGGGQGRRTLADVLARMGRSADSLGGLQVANPFVDRKLTGHMKAAFHLH
jgi:ribosomal protein S5